MCFLIIDGSPTYVQKKKVKQTERCEVFFLVTYDFFPFCWCCFGLSSAALFFALSAILSYSRLAIKKTRPPKTPITPSEDFALDIAFSSTPICWSADSVSFSFSSLELISINQLKKVSAASKRFAVSNGGADGSISSVGFNGPFRFNSSLSFFHHDYESLSSLHSTGGAWSTIGCSSVCVELFTLVKCLSLFCVRLIRVRFDIIKVWLVNFDYFVLSI